MHSTCVEKVEKVGRVEANMAGSRRWQVSLDDDDGDGVGVRGKAPDVTDITPTHGAARRLAAFAASEEAAHPAITTPEQLESQARLQVLIESRAIWSAILGGALGLAFGLVVFPGERPALAGDGSIQFFGAIVGGVTAGLAFLLGFSLNTRMANIWLGERPRIRQLMDTVALLVVHSSIAVMGALGIFRVFQEAFVGLTVDYIAGSVLLAIGGAVAAYFSFNSGARINAFSLSTLLGVFMASGVLVSMLFAENPFWWHVMFSELGTGQAGLTSFWTFNTTLVVSGLIITTLTAFITRDLQIWAEHVRRRHLRRLRSERDLRRAAQGRVPRTMPLRHAVRRHFRSPRIGVVRTGMIGMGVSLVGVGLVPVNLHNEIHATFTALFGLFFLMLLVGMPYWLPGFPRAFFLLSMLSAGVLIFAASLWRPIGYYNLTSLELIGAAILFAWLIVFIRNIAAVVAQVYSQAAAEQESRRRGRAEAEPWSGDDWQEEEWSGEG
ncbi:hypothetical protein [Nesterenkonia sp. HG001]|uniref:hypothetical protein n=1 Tax=Nesterenkonia sp. HG001 TaxID=2983207 RepID=UPI002AC6D07D|nr:hypothetical protein [Nesterenkonia sp. HG001]MDZ5077146.1 hypothetical protein [Nesterenkonia sp. HG001]